MVRVSARLLGSSRAVRRPWGLLAVVSLLAVHVVLGAGPAVAHAALVATDPGDGAVLDQVPQTVTLRFSEDIEPHFVAVSLRRDGATPERLSAGTDGAQITAEMPAMGAQSAGASRWQVDYRVVSADGHPITGSLRFTVAATGGQEAPTSTAPPTTPEPEATDTSPDEVTPGQNAADAGVDNDRAWMSTLIIGGITVVVVVAALSLLSRGPRRRD